MIDLVALRKEYFSEHGECHYCAGRTYSSPTIWRRHLVNQHPNTIRTQKLLDLIKGTQECDRDGCRRLGTQITTGTDRFCTEHATGKVTT